jgi:hypothetical protein
MRDLLRTKHFIVRLDEATHIVSRVRTGERFESIAEIEAQYDALVEALDRVDRARYAQLVDVRDAPPRNDPQFEEVVRRHHVALYRGFQANALLAQSAVGKLQLKRLLEASGVVARVFSEESEAVEFLTAAVAGRG